MVPFADGEERIDITWDTTGADSVMVWTGYDADNFGRTELVGKAGQISLTYGHNIMNGHAGIRIKKGDQVLEREVNVRFNCEFEYVFNFDWLPVDDQPIDCPAEDVQTAVAAYQPFENGFMVWVRSVRHFSYTQTYPAKSPPEYIAVFVNSDYEDGRGSVRFFDDSWLEEEESVDQPPSGLHQPSRGFGKVWRENSWVREELGWATASEQGYAMQHQYATTLVFQGYPTYFNLPTNEVIQMWSGGWNIMLP